MVGENGKGGGYSTVEEMGKDYVTVRVEKDRGEWDRWEKEFVGWMEHVR